MTLVLLETLRPTTEEQSTICMENPELVLQATQLSEVFPLLKNLQSLVADGYWAAGFLAYEAGYAFLPNMPPVRSTGLPFAWFALAKHLSAIPVLENETYTLTDLLLNLNVENYTQAIESIRRFIEEGETYQVNFTMRYRGGFQGSTHSLYRELRQKQRVSYAALIETREWSILSLSPELFFRKNGQAISMRPMKGTAPRGRSLQEDNEIASQLAESAKERSENLMIVDLLRNDLGKVCEPGTVQVTAPLEVERYETVLQMTSSIQGSLRKQCTAADIFLATFPSGSVTGAPKLRTMQIIHELEPEPRSIYTGSIGFIHGQQAVFNVAIRTAVVDHSAGTIEMGVGSGILHEADATREYEECELKGRFLTEPMVSFQLLETMLWQPLHGIRHLSLHLKRLEESAKYFAIPLDIHKVEQLIRNLDFPDERRIRLLVNQSGIMNWEDTTVEALKEPRVRFAAARTDSSNNFLYHKTTNRPLYDAEFQKARSEGFFDLIFSNEHGEITEGAISNIFVRKDGIYYTPPIACGLLPGTYREYLLESKPFSIAERVLYKEDLVQADVVYLTNSIRGLIEVQFMK